MPLRRVEEERRFRFHRLGPLERERVAGALAEALAGREEVEAATLYGGFTKYSAFRDVDVAVFTGYRVRPEDVEDYEEALSMELEKLVGLPVDVKVVDYAPPWFRAEAMGGRVLVEKSPALAARLRFKALQEVRDIRAKYRLLQQGGSKGRKR